MVKFHDLLQWSGNSLADAGDALIAASHKYEFASHELTDLRIDNFKGESADAEIKKRRILADDAEDLRKQITDAGRDLIDIATTADEIRESAHALLSGTTSQSMSITADGEVVPTDTAPPEETDEKDGKSQAVYQIECTHLMDRANSMIQSTNKVFHDIINLKNTALAPRQEIINHGTSAAPDASWTPEDVKDWWTSLSAEERQSVIDSHPEWIGNLNGIPMAVRDQANRKRIPEMRKKIDEQVRDFEPKTIKKIVRYQNDKEVMIEENPEYRKLLEKQKDIHALERSINSEDSSNVGRTLILLDDSQSDRIRAAVGSGNIDYADNVLVFTPGMKSRVSSTLATEDGGRGSGVERTENIMDESGLSWRKNDANHGEGTAAGITYLGYDSPQDIDVARQTGPAEDGGRDLANLYEGIQTSHEGDPHLVTVGYSYGSLVDGYAHQLTHAPDDAIVVGSPGLPLYGGGSTVNGDDLNMIPGNMYAAGASGDPVSGTSAHGLSPTMDDLSDFASIETGEEDGLKGVTGHNDYFERGSTSAHGMGQVLRNENPTHIADDSQNHPITKRPWPK